MSDTRQDVFAEVNQQINDSIRAFIAALETGKPGSDLLRASKTQADEGLARLRALDRPPGRRGENVTKVIEHLDIYRTALDSVESAPELSGKLLKHLLEEQLEISGEISESRAAHGPVDTGTQSRGPESPTADGLLPGGRRPLTVGSLIGR